MGEEHQKANKPQIGLPAGKPVKLTEEVDYASGSIVSKTIARSSAGTLTLFAFDQNQSLSEHSAPYDAYAQILEGEGTLRIGGERILAAEGETVRMPANKPHAVEAHRRFKMLLIMLKG